MQRSELGKIQTKTLSFSDGEQVKYQKNVLLSAPFHQQVERFEQRGLGRTCEVEGKALILKK